MHACMLSHFSCVRLFATQWTVAHKAPLSMGFSRQEQWSEQSFPSRDLSNPGIEPSSLVSPALAGRFFMISATWEVLKGRQKETNIVSYHLYVESKKKEEKDINEFIYKTEIDSQTLKTNLPYQRGNLGERDKLRVWE